VAAGKATFFRLYDVDEDPQALLDAQNQWSAPWGEPDHGPCDKCEGTGRTRYECRSCLERAKAECPACGGRVRFEDVCPACEGSGVIDRTVRSGVSVFPSLEGLYRYIREREVDLDGCVVVELEGRLTQERDLDADAGALLVTPTRIVSRREIERKRV
jgi:hypothetical protein